MMTVYFHNVPPQGTEGVPLQDSPKDPLHDQLAGAASAGHHPAHRLLVPGGLDVRGLPEPGQEVGAHRRGLHARRAAVQHVPAGSLGLHDGCR